MNFICPQCHENAHVSTGSYNYRIKKGWKVYCSRTCSSAARRKWTEEEKKQIKSNYDRQRKSSFSEERLKDFRKQKHEYFKKTYDKEKAAITRQARMPKHVEYCRRPEYRAKKRAYDEERVAKNSYGEFWEAAIVLKNLEVEVDNREAKSDLKLVTKSQKRKRRWIQALKIKMTLPRVD